MGAQPRVTARQRRSSVPEPTHDDVHELAARLARELRRAETDGGKSGASGSNEVLLDVSLDGLRITVLREGLLDPDRRRMVLSPREHEIARMVAKGYPNKTIASVLEISVWTVSTHLRRMFAKMDVTSRAAMVAQLLEAGVIARGAPADGTSKR
jgi:DNA-binding CsgD family transcriptional regulator